MGGKEAGNGAGKETIPSLPTAPGRADNQSRDGRVRDWHEVANALEQQERDSELRAQEATPSLPTASGPSDNRSRGWTSCWNCDACGRRQGGSMTLSPRRTYFELRIALLVH